MKHTYLHDVLPFLRELEREKQKQFEAYFRTAPLWLMDLFQSEIMEAGTTFLAFSISPAIFTSPIAPYAAVRT